MYKFSTGINKNGNKVCTLRIKGERGFSVETNGNMPRTHQSGVCLLTRKEFCDYVMQYGTDRQKALIRRKFISM